MASEDSAAPAAGAGTVAGLVLAAGGGRRLGGRPKALLRHHGRPLVEHAVAALRGGGCTRVHVVLGAAAERVRATVALPGCVLVDNPAWQDGMGSSLRAGLASLTGNAAGASPVAAGPGTTAGGSEPGTTAGESEPGTTAGTSGPGGAPSAVLVLLVDQPGIGAAAVARVRRGYVSPASLVAAAYGGRRGHPVLLGADHWTGVAAAARGDRGARDYLAAHAPSLTLVECADVADAYDIDTAADLARLAPR